ncbi:hypothetical protein KAR91_38935 [Candidatus Pacearchaeota archaeon]|nr:hypothetical protein [Candidatus Pacearchaeota archaeon]
MIYEFTLTYDVTVETLTINPAGWDDTGISYIRNSTYNSVLRSLSVKLRFARKDGGGGALIKTAYDTDGLSALVEVEIKKRNTQTDAFDSYYTGILEFKPSTLNIERDFVEINIIDGSKENKFITRDEINYDLDNETSSDGVSIDAFVSSPLEVNLPPINIFLEALSTGDLDGSDGPLSTLSGSFLYNGVESFNNIGARIKLDDGTLKIYENTSAASIDIKVTYDMIWSVDFLYTYVSGPPNDGTFTSNAQFIAKNSGGGTLATRTLFTQNDSKTDIGSNQLSQFNGSADSFWLVTIPASGYVELSLDYTYVSNPVGTITGTVTSNNTDFSQLDIAEIYDSPVAESPAKMYLPHEVFTRLVQLMTSETDETKLFFSPEVGRTDSEFVTYGSDGDYSLFALTVGKAIRQFPDPRINISMNDFFQTMKSIAPLGLGYDRTNERFFVDTIDQFYKNSSMFDLGDVKTLKITPYDEGFFSQTLGGYKNKVKYEEIQGVLEFNVAAEYGNLTPVKEKQDIQIPVNGDSVGIELARRKQYAETGTEDTDYDENLYIVSTERASGFTALVGSDYTSVAGFTGIEQYYNIDISPKRNLLRWDLVLAVTLWKDLTSVIQFLKTQTNVNITTQLAAETPVVETADVNASDLSNPLYYPEQYEFLAPVNATVISALNSDPHRYVTFSFDGATYTGYLLSVEMSDYKENATWKLIRANTTR